MVLQHSIRRLNCRRLGVNLSRFAVLNFIDTLFAFSQVLRYAFGMSKQRQSRHVID